MVRRNGMLCAGDRQQTLVELRQSVETEENKENEEDNGQTKRAKGGRKYCFHSMAELKEFAVSPPKFLDAVQQCLVRYPELINIVGLNEQTDAAPQPLVALQLNSMLPQPMTDVPRKASQGVGTPTHFVESNIVPDYSWNEWELRRRALQIVDMRLKQVQTHSTQTDLSHYRRDNATQYYLKQPLADGTMPGTETQTGIERATNVPKQHKYITGLRGKPNEAVSVVTLTFDPPIKRMN